MRTAPTLSVVSGTDYYQIAVNVSDLVNDFTIFQPSTNATTIFNSTQASGTTGQAGLVHTNNASSFIAFQAEL